MDKNDILEYKKKISKLNETQKKIREIELRELAKGEKQGPLTGYPSIDKVWLKHYSYSECNTTFLKMNMKQLLFSKNINNLDNIAINYYGNKISYKELFNNIENAKKSFKELGVKAGDVVSIAAPFIPETIYSIYAINALGGVVNLVDPRVPSEKFLNYFKGSNTKFLVAFNACIKKIKEIEKESNIEKTILISSSNSLPNPLKIIATIKEKTKNNVKLNKDKYLSWNNFLKLGKNKSYVMDNEYEENKPAIIVYTSGTSGEPKGAISSNESFNNIAISQDISLRLKTKLGDKFLLIMPPFIAYGIAIGMHGQLCRGQELIMVPSFNIDNEKQMLGDLVKKYKPQTIMGVPAFMSDLTLHPKMQNMDLSFLKTVIVGGDSMIPSAEERVNEFLKSRNSEARICKGWGLTEVNSAFSYTKDIETNEIGSVGIPLVGNDIMVVKPNSSDNIDFDNLEELTYDQTGELFINSKSVILDYLNNEEESKNVFFTSKDTNEKWIRTKDLGRVTKDGLIYIDGRMKRIIIRPDGHNISPFAIESIINKNEKVKACAVVGKSYNENEHGSYAVAYIELKKEFLEQQKEILMELKKEVEKKLPPRDIASEYKVIDEIPLTNIGKVDYKSLEQIDKKRILK